MADFAQSCDSHCAELSLQCVASGAFPSGRAVELLTEMFSFSCKNVESYRHTDQPCYAPNDKACLGAKSIPNKIDCAAGHNFKVRRLCPCA